MKNGAKKKLMPAWLRLTLLVLCGAILGVNVYLANANSLVGNKLPTPFGYGAAVVLSGSMEPEFSKGDLIVVKETGDFALRDVVVFQDGEDLVTHRIIEIDGDTVTTKGDANNTADEPIPAKNIKGKVLFHIPFAGNIVNFIKTPVGTLCILALAIVLLELPRRKEKERDDEEREKLLDEIRRLKADVFESAESSPTEPEEDSDAVAEDKE